MEGKSFSWFPFWYVQCLCDIKKIFVENICNFVFLIFLTFFFFFFFSINVTVWLHCEPFSVKKGLKSFQKFLFFILSLVELQLLWKFYFAFLFSFRNRFCCFLYAFRSSSFPLLFALFLILDLVMISFLRRDVRWGLLFSRTMRV